MLSVVYFMFGNEAMIKPSLIRKQFTARAIGLRGLKSPLSIEGPVRQNSCCKHIKILNCFQEKKKKYHMQSVMKSPFFSAMDGSTVIARQGPQKAISCGVSRVKIS